MGRARGYPGIERNGTERGDPTRQDAKQRGSADLRRELMLSWLRPFMAVRLGVIGV